MIPTIREFTPDDIPQMCPIWNYIVSEGNSFPQEDHLSESEALEFFSGQSFTGVAQSGSDVVGLYILHPNNIGRCGHIANASYAVDASKRGKHIGEELVKHSLTMGAKLGFRILQFNAVVASNKWAIHLYKKLGFTPLGTIPGGFRMGDDEYADIIPFYIPLV
ncbi:MAG: GNAT family N-acetyltransferase [Lachnospiraceae bacterium]|jgi:L-amino acid N-acyltransferase YncA|nr:GNAT family N-acetyltransferase [Lachnospiraceae bacterium]